MFVPVSGGRCRGTAFKKPRQSEPRNDCASKKPEGLPAREVAYIADKVADAAIPQTLRKLLYFLSGIPELPGNYRRLLIELDRGMLHGAGKSTHRFSAAPLLVLSGSL
jgi:hypothetical protein